MFSFIAIGIVLAPRVINVSTPGDEILGSMWLDAIALGTGLALGVTYTVYRHAGLHAPGADLLLATLPSALLIGIVCLYMPCGAPTRLSQRWRARRAVWRSRSFLCLALGDAVLIVIDVFARGRSVSGSEVRAHWPPREHPRAAVGFARFGDVPSAWTVAGGRSCSPH